VKKLTSGTPAARYERRSLGLQGQAVQFRFSTEDVRDNEQFAYWREALCQAATCLTPERDEPGPFRAWARGRMFGGAMISEGAAPRYRLTRTRSDLARVAASDYILVVRLAADARYVFGERELLVREGEGLVVDSLSFKASEYSGAMRCGAIRIPQHLLRPRLAAPDAPLALHLSNETPLGRLICSYARNVVDDACGGAFDTLAATDETTIVKHICALLSLAIGAKSDGGDAAHAGIAAARLDAIEAYLAANFANPRLSPASVAAQFGISVRYLDKMFERTGRSFMETLLERRLSACCAMLSGGADDRQPPIAEIAKRAGFTSLTQFNRRFRATYGLTPRGWRATRR
jgi:AraC family transcriptional activator of tynA and feaB